MLRSGLYVFMRRTLISLQYFCSMDFSQQMTIIRETMWAKSLRKESKVKFIAPEKWRSLMRKSLEKFKTKGIFDNNMIEDLDYIISKIPEDRFVEATLNLQPFKPIFSERTRKHKDSRSKNSSDDMSEEEETQITRTKFEESPQFKGSIIKFKESINEKIMTNDFDTGLYKNRKTLLDEVISLVTEELTLVNEFQAKYHPFRKIREQFLLLLESKYKMMIEAQDNVDVEQIQEKLIIDLRLLQEFIVRASEPYLQLFKTQNIEQQEIFRLKLIAFIKHYVQKHQKINLTIRKIMRAACRKSKLIRHLSSSLPDFATMKQFSVPQQYQIDGCYAHSMTTLISFCECTSSLSSLKKLRELRFCLGKDLDLFYKEEPGPRHMELTSETQLQIVKFLVAKLKAFVCEIYAQLKYLQVVCGEEDMSYKFDDSSYMYAQLSVALEALELDFS